MEVLSLNEGLLTNVEVLELLEERRAERVVAPHNNVAQLDREHVELQTMRYLKASPIRDATGESVIAGLNALRKLDLVLTEGEMVQLANHLPVCEVEVYAIVEECSERFTTEQVTLVIETLKGTVVQSNTNS